MDKLSPVGYRSAFHEDRLRAAPSNRFSFESLLTGYQVRMWTLGRSNWLFAGTLRSGKRAAAIMSLIQSGRMNGHYPYAYRSAFHEDRSRVAPSNDFIVHS